MTSTLKLEAQKSSPPNNPLSVKNHPKNLKSLRGYVELNFKCPLLTRKNNSNCWQPTGRLYFATSKRSTADGPPRRTIKVKTPSIHPYLTNTLKVESQFLCVFDVISIDNNIHKVRVYIYIYLTTWCHDTTSFWMSKRPPADLSVSLTPAAIVAKTGWERE